MYFCLKEGAAPQDMSDFTNSTLYKNKGDLSNYNNYHSITLLNIVGKLYAWVVLKRNQILTARVYPQPQCSYQLLT